MGLEKPLLSAGKGLSQGNRKSGGEGASEYQERIVQSKWLRALGLLSR